MSITLLDIHKARKVAFSLRDKAISPWGKTHYQDLIESIDMVLHTTESFKKNGRLKEVQA
jgi:hypothetical protein